jgi:hypothetical protein
MLFEMILVSSLSFGSCPQKAEPLAEDATIKLSLKVGTPQIVHFTSEVRTISGSTWMETHPNGQTLKVSATEPGTYGALLVWTGAGRTVLRFCVEGNLSPGEAQLKARLDQELCPYPNLMVCSDNGKLKLVSSADTAEEEAAQKKLLERFPHLGSEL